MEIVKQDHEAVWRPFLCTYSIGCVFTLVAKPGIHEIWTFLTLNFSLKAKIGLG